MSQVKGDGLAACGVVSRHVRVRVHVAHSAVGEARRSRSACRGTDGHLRHHHIPIHWVGGYTPSSRPRESCIQQSRGKRRSISSSSSGGVSAEAPLLAIGAEEAAPPDDIALQSPSAQPWPPTPPPTPGAQWTKAAHPGRVSQASPSPH